MSEYISENHIYIIGIGMGDPRNLTVEAAEAIEAADLLIGAKRMLAPYEKSKRCVVSYQTEEILQFCLSCEPQKQIAVLMSGDSGFFSGTKALLAAFRAKWSEAVLQSRVTVLPGISSLSYFCARIGKSWEDTAIVNLHGMQENLWQAVLTHEKVFAVTGGNVRQQLQRLAEHGLGDVYGYVGENLSYSAASLESGYFAHDSYAGDSTCAGIMKKAASVYVDENKGNCAQEQNWEAKQGNAEPNILKTEGFVQTQEDEKKVQERIAEGTVRELAQKEYAPLAVLYLENPAAVSSNLWGLPDESFIRGEVPMTKAEVRAVVMSKLRIRDKDVVYDIGAGTGSVSVEMALAARRGKVYAVETNPDAVELCKLNKERFCLHNMEIIEGMAPEALQELPAPDVAFIGGSKGYLQEIVELLYRKNPAVRLVINTITIENTAKALALLESEQFTDVEMVQLQVSRAKKAGASHMLTAQNPVTILSARGKGMIQPGGMQSDDAQPDMIQPGGILIAATGSGSGKTMFTCGLLRLLAHRGLDPCAFKCGPDYIDPTFHRRALGVPSYNLDPFFTGEKVLRQLYEIHSAAHGISVVEGVMGYYDGLGFTDEASTYSVAKALELPVLLLVDCKGMGHSVTAVVEGFARHRQPSGIRAVVFNRMSPSLYEKAAETVRGLGILPLGYLPEDKGLHLESRHLGLLMADEVQDFTEKIDRIAGLIGETVDVDGLIRLAGSGMPEQSRQFAVHFKEIESIKSATYISAADCVNKIVVGNKTRYEKERAVDKAGEVTCPEINKFCTALRIAVARDEAFCFLYEDNLNFLREKGAEIVFFSPLHDCVVPADCDALYLSGGYPELYAPQLEQNISMRTDIREKIAAGMPCIAECGGFLYLHEQLEASEKIAEQVTKQSVRVETQHFYEMAGIIPAQAVNRRRKGRFGYIEATLMRDCLLGKKGDTFRAHEFHYWETTMEQADLHVRKPGNGNTWTEGLCTDTLYAGFPHLYFYGSPEAGENFLAAAGRYRGRLQSDRGHGTEQE